MVADITGVEGVKTIVGCCSIEETDNMVRKKGASSEGLRVEKELPSKDRPDQLVESS